MGNDPDLDALVFDFDGLILDTEWTKYTAVSEAFAAHGVELPVDEWREAVGRTDSRHWTDWLEDAVGAPIDRATIYPAGVARSLALLDAEVVRPGVVELLDAATRRGIALAVASSSPSDWVEPHLDRLGLLAGFDAVVTREDVVATKPAPDLYLAAVAAIGAVPARSVALEDSAHGCTAAVAAGLRCVVAPNRLTRRQDFDHADLVVTSLADVDVAMLAALVVRGQEDSSATPTEP
jgi:HAD superfamily hydrolase (TIGR01509 family)